MRSCRLCKEPIWNFLCTSCLSKDIMRLLSRKRAEEFQRFHRTLTGLMGKGSALPIECLKCGSSRSPPICIDCYLNEVYTWFKDKDPGMIGEISAGFSFDFRLHETIMKEHEFVPVTEEGPDINDTGLCEQCGEYSEDLRIMEGEWVCGQCREQMGINSKV